MRNRMFSSHQASFVVLSFRRRFLGAFLLSRIASVLVCVGGPRIAVGVAATALLVFVSFFLFGGGARRRPLLVVF